MVQLHSVRLVGIAAGEFFELRGGHAAQVEVLGRRRVHGVHGHLHAHGLAPRRHQILRRRQASGGVLHAEPGHLGLQRGGGAHIRRHDSGYVRLQHRPAVVARLVPVGDLLAALIGDVDDGGHRCEGGMRVVPTHALHVVDIADGCAHLGLVHWVHLHIDQAAPFRQLPHWESPQHPHIASSSIEGASQQANNFVVAQVRVEVHKSQHRMSDVHPERLRAWQPAACRPLVLLARNHLVLVQSVAAVLRGADLPTGAVKGRRHVLRRGRRRCVRHEHRASGEAPVVGQRRR
mmetsp:Transcript_15838/g.47674  ORF Transcript_15838/g.47674 Transcript_15838/m.47674 type:complete len:290 (+) Transcript_15838:795-1664(+)